MINTIVDRKYFIIKKIGDQGQVYIAQNLTTDKAVALKLLDLSDNNKKDSLEIKELFKRESEALSQLNHNNIIKYLDSGLDEQRKLFYIATEYIPGGSLEKYIKDSQLKIEEILDLFSKILKGIAEAHNKNILHRDLKPSNILIEGIDTPKIIDFGLSKILGIKYRNSTQTLKDYMTIHYASPEQVARKELNVQSDIFSAGATLFYMLSKKAPPIDRDRIKGEIDNIQCSSNLKRILKKVLEPDLEERYANVHELIREINQEYHNVFSESKNFYIKFTNKVAAELFELGKVPYRSNINAENFIKNDLSKSSIYKGNRYYFIVGNTVKYQCRLSDDNSHIVIDKVFVIENFIRYEEEYQKGIDSQISWIVVNQYNDVPYNTDLMNLLDKVNVEKQKRDVRLSRERQNNLLINKWEKYLDEENSLNDKKGYLGIYSDLEYNFETNKIKVRVSKLDYTIENGDLIQLTDKRGEQVTVGTFDSIEELNIVISVKNDVDLDDLEKRGKIGIDVIQSAAAIKRFRRAVRALKFGDLLNPNIKDIIVEPSIAAVETSKEINEFIDENLDELNKVAVKKALSTKDLFLIQGPPGTGKTTVITEIVGQILKENPNNKILLASPSHVAVDHAIQSIIKNLDKDKRIIRVGRSERISKESQYLLISNQLEKWVEGVKRNSKDELLNYLNQNHIMNKELSDEIQKEIENISINDISDENNPLFQAPSNVKRIVGVIKEWHRRLNSLEEFDEIFAQEASVVAATCTGIASRHVLNDIAFDWVIIDEAARATAPELLLPMIRGKKIILVGDHQQLPPIVGNQRSNILDSELGIKTSDLEKSLFEELFEKISDEAKSVLTAQFRMHPTISKLINDVFYPTTTIEARKAPEERKHLLQWTPKSIVWLNTQYLEDNREQESLNSYKNSSEAKVILKQLEEVEELYKGVNPKIKVGVISGYDAQKKLLINLIKPHDQKWQNINIMIDNVDAFQGSETDISIYNIVRCNDQNKIGFLRDERRLNVALSRGKTCLIIVGNADFANKAKTYKGNPFADIIRFIDRHPMECVMEDIM
ncbi:serine/threonine-protein kinase [Cytobacillus oceanisediminis]|uniref:serine/threonine-protein kinase n=1 Tax=Cytobacillus oceanisediminis TaxID=665099 RepID=UPI00203B4004|nr:serine/threonine-protein kinase [Cytobacillus oceanisediminis]MCM3393089.1 AAA domain-containing protein [Cytobacillus oceanisediminis]